MEFKETEPTISLHGLGFLQVKLGGKQRLHVWHPDLPRRRCHEHSSIHDHRFCFESRVLVGSMVNLSWSATLPTDDADGTHWTYLHEGERTEKGNRPWTRDNLVTMRLTDRRVLSPGELYAVQAYRYHSTQPLGDGRVATLMTKVWEGTHGAHSACRAGVDPDVDFDRFQLSETEMWNVVREVLSEAER